MTHSDPDDVTTELVIRADKPFTRDGLSALFASPDREPHTGLRMGAGCHPGVGLIATYCSDCATLTLQCASCGQLAAGFIIGAGTRH